MSCSTLVVFAGSLIGNELAPNEKLSTIPVALFVIGTAVSTVPLALLMKKFGRKSVFMAAAVLGLLIAGLAAYGVILQSFIFFCTTIFLLGITIAAVQQFRFAAMESVPVTLVPKAASRVLLGGIVSAFLGPEVAVLGKDLLPQEFAGSFILLGILYVLGLLLLTQYKNTVVVSDTADTATRPIGKIARQPVFGAAVLGAVVGYSVMTFIMTATPISMHVMHGHSLESTKWVIQSHIVAMFLPSLFTAWVINKLGIAKMMLTGLLAYVACLILAYIDITLMHYWTSLVLLGIGWNFLFIGGTTLLPESYTEGERFKVQALNEFLVFGTQALASIGAGWVLFQLGWQNLLLLIIPLLLVQSSAILYWKSSKKSTT